MRGSSRVSLAVGLMCILSLSCPPGNAMHWYQWAQYFLGTVAIFSFGVIPSKE